MPAVYPFVLAIALGCATTSSFSAVLKDEKLSRAMEGTWCTSFDGGRSCLGYDEYQNGKITSCGGMTSTGVPSLVEGRYSVIGNRSCTLITASNEPTVKPGGQVCIEILDINKTSLHFGYVSIENLELQLNPHVGGVDAGIPLYRVSPDQMTCRDPGK